MKSLEMVNEYIEDIKNSKVYRDDGLTEFAVLHLDELEVIKQDLEVLDLIYTKHVDISDLKMAMALEKDRNYKEEDGLRFYNIAPFNVKRITIDEYKKLKQWMEERV